MKKPLMYLVRHGSTTDSGQNIFRGQRNSALDRKGFLDAHKLKEFFQDKQWDRIFCSPMTRAIQTATIICDDQSEYQPETIPGLEPWDIGPELTGSPKNAANKKKMDFFIENPAESPEGGESRFDFEHRVWPILAEAIELGWHQEIPCVVVGHSSVVHSLSHLIEGESHKEVAVKPGGVVEVFMEDGEIGHRPIFKSGTDDSSFDAGRNS
jgi:broad specificity phosphatase PhoE